MRQSVTVRKSLHYWLGGGNGWGLYYWHDKKWKGDGTILLTRWIMGSGDSILFSITSEAWGSFVYKEKFQWVVKVRVVVLIGDFPISIHGHIHFVVGFDQFGKVAISTHNLLLASRATFIDKGGRPVLCIELLWGKMWSAIFLLHLLILFCFTLRSSEDRSGHCCLV